MPQLQRLLSSNLLVLFTESRKRYESSLSVLLTELQKTTSDHRNLGKTACYCRTLSSVKVSSRCIKRINRKKKLVRNIPTRTEQWKNWIFSAFDLMVKMKRNLNLETTQPQSANCIENCVGFSKRIRIVIYSLDSEPDCFVLRPYFGRKRRRGLSFLLFVRETTETVFSFCLYWDEEVVFTAEEPVFLPRFIRARLVKRKVWSDWDFVM